MPLENPKFVHLKELPLCFAESDPTRAIAMKLRVPMSFITEAEESQQTKDEISALQVSTVYSGSSQNPIPGVSIRVKGVELTNWSGTFGGLSVRKATQVQAFNAAKKVVIESAALSQLLEMNGSGRFPDLWGSDAQIAWAEDIRAHAYATDPALQEKTSAKWWIENRERYLPYRPTYNNKSKFKH